MGRTSDKTTRFLPLSPQDFHVLLVLKDEPRHGYGIVRAAEEQFTGNLGLDIGTLYRIVARLLEHGLVRELDPKDLPQIDGRKRRFYQATKLGVQVARAEAIRLRVLLSTRPAAELLESE